MGTASREWRSSNQSGFSTNEYTRNMGNLEERKRARGIRGDFISNSMTSLYQREKKLSACHSDRIKIE
jgi:hypothetical protein